MAGFNQPLTVCISRRNPVRVPRRNLLVVSSDTPVLALTVYQSDTDVIPLNVGDASFLLSIYRERDQRSQCWAAWDYGFAHDDVPYVVTQFSSVQIDPVNGRVDISLFSDLSRWVVGRFSFELTMSYGIDSLTGIGVLSAQGLANPNYQQGNLTILTGVIQFTPGAHVAPTQRPELLGGIGIG